jgi:hypothetical protein
MPIQSAFNFAHASLDEVLDDLCVRFIINCPPEELASVEVSSGERFHPTAQLIPS